MAQSTHSVIDNVLDLRRLQSIKAESKIQDVASSNTYAGTSLQCFITPEPCALELMRGSQGIAPLKLHAANAISWLPSDSYIRLTSALASQQRRCILLCQPSYHDDKVAGSVIPDP